MELWQQTQWLGSLASTYCVRRRYASPRPCREGGVGETDRSLRETCTVGSRPYFIEGSNAQYIEARLRGDRDPGAFRCSWTQCFRSLVVCKERDAFQWVPSQVYG